MDLATVEQNKIRRRSLRRAVRIETDVLSDGWDQAVSLLATDLSPEGLWLESDLPLEVGEEVVVSLRPPRWMADKPFRALAQVARVGLFRRKSEHRRSGMGLRFVQLDSPEADFLNLALRGLPPPLPTRGTRRAVIELQRPSSDESFGLPELELPDGRRFVFRAESALLTAGRGPMLTNEVTVRRLATVHKLSSPMSAIFDRAATRTRLVGSVAC